VKHLRATAVAITALGIAAVPATANAGWDGHGHHDGGRDDASITTVATGLAGPRQLNEYRDGKFVVAESDSGEVASVDVRTGEVKTLLTGLYSPQGVDSEDGLLFVALGGPPPPDEVGAPQPAEGQPSSGLLIAEPGGEVVRFVDLLAYEVANNPDGQDPNAPDSRSNPFSVLVQDERVLVADAGANDVLAVDPRTGDISTFFVPPVVTDGGCAGAQNNPGTVGCDPVPTGVAEGPDGLIYVSTLGAEVPGASRIYVLDQCGRLVRVIKGLTATTGVAVGGDGAVYAPELLAGAPEGAPPAGFDPSTVGDVVRIDRHDGRTFAQVTTPSSVVFEDGALYSTADALPLGPNSPPGSVVRIGAGAFVAP
jgi:hypothetical protein